MKRTALFSFTLFLFAIVYTSCQEDIYMDWKLQNERFYTTLKDSLNNDTLFHKTSSGLYYKVLHQGYQRIPNATSEVILNYKLSLVDGSTVEKVTRGDFFLPYVVRSMSTHPVKGLTEGITKMNGGGSYIFYVPSSLAFDTISDNKAIPPHTMLIYEVDLVDSRN